MCDEDEFDEDNSRLILGPIRMQRWIYSCSKQPLDRVIWDMEIAGRRLDTPERIAGLENRLEQRAFTIEDKKVQYQYLNTFRKEVRDYADSMKFSFKDTNMIHVHVNMLEFVGDTIKMMYSDDQTGIVIPENHLLMQAMLFEKAYDDSLKHTEELFHMEEKKKLLEEHFAKK
jgi:hypothetical protein